MAVQNRSKHQRLVQQRIDALLVRLDSRYAILCE